MRFSDIDRTPSRRTLRQFAALWIVFFGGMAAWKAAAGSTKLGYTLAALALTVGGIGLASPRTVRSIYIGWMILAFPVGWLISRVVLCAVYFVVFLPIGVWFRLIGRDPLALKRPAGETYWTEKPSAEDASRYFLQY